MGACDVEGAPPSPEVDDAKQFMHKLMDHPIRVAITDGRLIVGNLWCVDNLKNFILLNCQETRISEDGVEQRRPLGPLVMVPGKHVTKVEALKSSVDRLSAAKTSEKA
mmetsp:Transcript_120139/g.299727  ORF Transcript_120139/g.299727 Transcript_120139/m.299727 type:complete len:108 (-) Transcript_120139:49-372(-)